MTKIVRAFPVEAAPQPLSLLKSLNEAGKLSDLFKRAVGAKPAPAEEERARPDEASATLDELSRLVSSMIAAPSGQTRFVIHCSFDDFSTHYLKQDVKSRTAFAEMLAKSLIGATK